MNIFNLFKSTSINTVNHNNVTPNAIEESLCSLIFQAVNQYRINNGSQKLTQLAPMNDLAWRHSFYLYENNIQAGDRCHSYWSERSAIILALPQHFGYASENIAAPELPIFAILEHKTEITNAILQGWLNSKKGHCQTIEGDYTHSGIGVVIKPDHISVDKNKDRCSIYVTQLFAM
jgi:uncharacterized protein YkwD